MNKKKKKRNAYQEFMDFVDSVVKELLIFMMICVVLCVLLQVAGRYLPFIKPLPWTEEIARWLLVWLTFLGASHIAKSSSYTRIDIFTSKMSPKVQKVISVISKLCMLGFVGVFAAKSLIVFTTVSVHEKGPSSQLPMLLMRSAVFVGMIITFRPRKRPLLSAAHAPDAFGSVCGNDHHLPADAFRRRHLPD